MTKSINQNQTIITFLSKNKRKKLTTNEICSLVNKTLPNKVKKLTVQQVSRCLNRFSVKNMVKIVDSNGVHPKTGRKASRWTYTPNV